MDVGDTMVRRRRSLLSEIYAEHKNAQHDRQLAQERAEKAADAARKQAEKEALARQRAAEKAERDAEQAQLRQAAAAVRALKLYEAEQRRQGAEAQRAAVQRRASDAEAMTRAAEARVGKLERILLDRSRHFVTARQYLEGVYSREGAEGFVAVLRQGLATSVYPEGFPGSSAALYRSEAQELLVEYELPRQTVIPAESAFRYVKTRDVIQAEPRKPAEIKKLYADLVARVTLRALAEAFDIAPPTLVDGIVFNGYVAAMDRATGKPIRPLLISTHATRDAFGDIRLDEPELDPVLCLRSYLNAVVSPHPYDLEPVRPVVQFDLSKYKFVEEMQIAAGLDSRPDLLALKPVEFEHLIRELFEAIGMKSWVTQASRDDGVDGVAVNEDPVVGGLCIIQAKRYSKIVGLEAVHALAGVMDDKRAAKGVLVTTSWVGKASRDFAARNGRIEIIEGRQLKSMLLEHLGLDALISLPTLPPNWHRDDIS
jgi:restriction system protein